MEPLPGVAVVLGGASSVWDDLERVKDLADDFDVIAVNDAGAHYSGEVEHWVSLHPEKFVGEFHAEYNPDEVNWIRIREENGYPGGYETWSRRDPQWVDHVTKHWGAGTSGLFAVTVALKLGYSRVILCGVPMDQRPHFDGATGREDEDGNWNEWDDHRVGWEDNQRRMDGRVRGMSGWTRQLLGEPDEEWIA